MLSNSFMMFKFDFMVNVVEDYKGTGDLTWLHLYTGVHPDALLIKRLAGLKSLFTSSRF